ncbi:Long-chain-fatty-acid--CoA ligase [Desulfurobacterium thermolithotrophum DSM 11699]|uniref:Long-chain-fatty-acid--CoA ligase n=1 Tax=Desulfurobacterium thermolithotrophum (strain DSM 11699 / BSA) TaxID=868864 RepID=F0S2M0_DESTD|nr:AMP-binding protein [Desulfurobacterium thermolithotrophum]ADY73092.1 Long-chain-fatty-acid--CoA ligase [Desulfurobacterium thermolithotrophum DSM 11699]
MKTFLERVLENIEEFPEKELFVKKEKGKYTTLSYKDFEKQISTIQKGLESIGLEDRVAIFMENRPEWISGLFAVLFKGGIAVPVDYLLSSEELFNIFKDCQPKVVITSSQNIEKVKEAIKNIGYHINILNVDELEFQEKEEKIQFIKRDIENVIFILYTSGTTGNPKGVMLTVKNLNHNIKAVEKLNILNEKDRFVAILPFHHTYPLMTTALLPATLGLVLVFIEKLTPTDILSTINEQNVTILIGVPKLYQVIHHNIMVEIKKLPKIKRHVVLTALKLFRKLDAKPIERKVFKEIHNRIGKNLRFMISGGAKLSEDVWRDFEAFGFNILEGYGLTETSPLISVNRPGKKKIGTAGAPIDEVEVKTTERGEIIVRGPNVMKGYYNKPKETEIVIKDGWFYTGDLGFIDEEGFIHITGRAKEVIVLDNGKNVYPEDIEIEIVKSPYILEVGVFYQDGGLKALIRPDFELLMEEGINNFKDIKEFIKEEIHKRTKHFQSYKKVKEFKLIDRELPRTRIGKLRRFLLPQVWKEVE